MNIGQHYLDSGAYQLAMDKFKEALPYASNSDRKFATAWCYYGFSVAQAVMGDYQQAAKNDFIALNALKKDDTAGLQIALKIYDNLARIYANLHQPDQEIHYGRLAENLARQGNYVYQLGFILNNIGCYYISRREPDSGMVYLTEALAIAKKNNFPSIAAYSNENIGEALIAEEKYEEAIPFLRRLLQQTAGKYQYVALCASYSLAEALIHQRAYKQAEHILHQALRQASRNELLENLVRGYTLLKEVYARTGQYKKAADCYENILKLNDSLSGISRAKEINQLDAKYQASEKDKKIAEANLTITLQNNTIAKKNLWITGIAGGICLLLLVSGSLYGRSRLQSQKIKSLQQENTISILRGMVQGSENERGHIARELHDGIGGMLSAIKMRFLALRNDNRDIINSPKYLEAMGLLDIMGDEIRKTSHNLMPETLLRQNLEDAIRAHCNSVQTGSALRVEFQSYGQSDFLTNDLKLNVYRIVQELIKNTLQHADADYLFVQLMIPGDMLIITVEDDGCGFDTMETKDGIGLQNIKTRVLSQGGEYSLKSEPGKGTNVHIEFELKDRKAV